MAEPHQHRREGDPEGEYVPTVRASWFSNNAMAVISMVIGLGSGVLGSWVTTQIRETKTEAALASIQAAVSKLEGKVDATSTTVNAAAVASGRLQADSEHFKSDLEKEAGQRMILESRTLVNEKAIEYLKAVAALKK